ncbi:hypothetical protein HMPREF0860_1303 [Treponema socranskii subsp. socranskii VPI DR56BR1116 = ATCC 35536]|uniref:Uncharacterized protein n=1 Tax=Treponema socranskii subsp. socranskii VPI DR56BR1116 = ATCC 35536 TaxID=1125725 RepID=U2MSP4_TRESO|nr:hypothetical protein HMPREF1325_1925 [Treponema socranskii subsp. socranskii VPI DR56BR1116 = ATCC 35536]ERK04670.1 hypothetical protein HMPREF0860_1303 [Treponema socranskii subsp. socranskii VPI DR56BR1116 = ATCC 35536]
MESKYNYAYGKIPTVCRNILTCARCGVAAGDTRATLCVPLAEALLKSTTGA